MNHLKLFEELYIRKKYADQNPGQHNILYLIGSRPDLTPDLGFNFPRRTKDKYNILSQFGDIVHYPLIHWRGGDMIFDEVEEIIEEKNIDVLVGYSAGGFISYYMSNKYKIPNLSINPAMAPTSEAPRLQTVPDEARKASICGKQLIVIGEEDSLANGGVDGDLVVKDLRNKGFEESGSEFLFLPGVRHRLDYDQFNDAFVYFYKKFVI